MISISCSGKFHAFALAEQMERKGLLDTFFTSYAYQRNSFASHFVKRIDKENIPAPKIQTNIPLAVLMKLRPAVSFKWNERFDKWVAAHLEKSSSKVFIGWSGMCLHSLRVAKAKGMKTIVERGSSHICYQDAILKEEYKKFGIDFSISPFTIDKELKEYEAADYISIPSFFVKRSFLQMGVRETKLLMNPYGAAGFFTYQEKRPVLRADKFRLVYLGTLSIRKGLIYLFEALQLLSIPEDEIDVWFIGNPEPDFVAFMEKYKKNNWKFLGHINHYELEPLLATCDAGVQPSLEEGLSMVIPQMMSCGIPVIITPNTGGENIVQDGINGFVVPIRDPQAIADKITVLFSNPDTLQQMRKAAAATIQNGFTWNDYGNRYLQHLSVINNE